ncbi:unnamed protein product, partial [Rotaria sp. Silwood1]
MVKSCMACSNTQSKSSSVTFHRLPVDKDKRHIWLKRLNRLDLKDFTHRVVCSLHFSTSAFTENATQKNDDDSPRGRRRLKPEAVPIESAAVIETTSDSRSITTQTDLDLTTL